MEIFSLLLREVIEFIKGKGKALQKGMVGPHLVSRPGRMEA
jgi:hypothetical protein